MIDKLLMPMRRLNDVLAAGASGHERKWIEQLNNALARVEQALTEHIAEADAPAGLFDGVDLARQGLLRQVNDLRGEHALLREQVQALHLKVNRLEKNLPAAGNGSELAGAMPDGLTKGPIPEVVVIRHQAEKFAKVLQQHWDEEADLLIENVIRDIGGRLYSIA